MNIDTELEEIKRQIQMLEGELDQQLSYDLCTVETTQRIESLKAELEVMDGDDDDIAGI